MKYFKVILAVSLLFLISCVSAQQSEKRIALIIGNGEYKFGSKLRDATWDASQIASELEKYNFKVIQGINCKRDSFDILIDHFIQQLNSYDVSLFYYNGLAINCEGESFIFPTDIDSIKVEDIETKLISLDSLILKIKETGLKKNFVITDTWRQNKFLTIHIRPGISVTQVPENFCLVCSGFPSNIEQPYYKSDIFTQELIKVIKRPNFKHNYVLKSLRQQIWIISKKNQLIYYKDNIDEPFYFNQNQ